MASLIGERAAQALWRDYLELTKPKVVVLMLITSLVGMFLATRAGVPWTVLVFGNLGKYHPKEGKSHRRNKID